VNTRPALGGALVLATIGAKSTRSRIRRTSASRSARMKASLLNPQTPTVASSGTPR